MFLGRLPGFASAFSLFYVSNRDRTNITDFMINIFILVKITLYPKEISFCKASKAQISVFYKAF